MKNYSLYETSFYRYFHIQELLLNKYRGKYWVGSFIDEYGKVTYAKYKVIEIAILPKEITLIFKLDARSLRYMRRKKVIENKPPGIHKEDGMLPMKIGMEPIK